MTQLNIRALDRLARTPAPPAPVAKAAVQTFTTIGWDAVPGASSYTVWQRPTDTPSWLEQPVLAHTTETQVKLDGVRGDDWIFGVSACTTDGLCSPVASAVPAGAFRPIAVNE